MRKERKLIKRLYTNAKNKSEKAKKKRRKKNFTFVKKKS